MSVVVDWRCIEAMAATYRRNALLVNESGYANYTSIENSYHEVRAIFFLFTLFQGNRPFSEMAVTDLNELKLN